MTSCPIELWTLWLDLWVYLLSWTFLNIPWTVVNVRLPILFFSSVTKECWSRCSHYCDGLNHVQTALRYSFGTAPGSGIGSRDSNSLQIHFASMHTKMSIRTVVNTITITVHEHSDIGTWWRKRRNESERRRKGTSQPASMLTISSMRNLLQ